MPPKLVFLTIIPCTHFPVGVIRYIFYMLYSTQWIIMNNAKLHAIANSYSDSSSEALFEVFGTNLSQ